MGLTWMEHMANVKNEMIVCCYHPILEEMSPATPWSWKSLIPRGAPDLTCLVRGRQWLSLPGKWNQMEADIDVNYIQHVYEHLKQTYS